MQSALKAFLSAHRFDTEGAEPDRLLADFAREMEAGLAGRRSSLPMIPAYIGTDGSVPPERPVIVIDAGGTNLRVATVRFARDGRPEIDDFHKTHMPGTRGEVTAEEFFACLADFVSPLAKASDRIGFCFSYRTEITPDGDGRLLRWSKQIRAPEVEGRLVGAELADRLERRVGHRHRIRVLNDTVATLLAGRSLGMARRFGGYVGYILGTGTNSAYIERHAAIAKLIGLAHEGRMAINIEAGGFARTPRSRFDELFDATTIDPGHYRLEKMTAGGYLGGLGLTMLREAADAGLFAPTAAEALRNLSDLSNKDLDDFCADPEHPPEVFARMPLDAAGRERIRALGTALYRRAANLAALHLAAVLIRSASASDPKLPICANIDGSTYYRTRSAEFRRRMDRRLDAILASRGIAYERTKVDDAPLIGAAVAGLSQNGFSSEE